MRTANHSGPFRMNLDLQQFAGEDDQTLIDAQPPDSDPPDITDPSPAPLDDVPKGRNVKYLSEDRFVPEEEVDTWVQKGLNHDRLQERVKGLETQAQMLERVAKFYGYENNDQFQQALEKAERDKNARAEAARLGMDEQLYQQYLAPVNEELQSTRQTVEKLQQEQYQRQIDMEVADLKSKYPDFDTYRDKAFDMAIQKGHTLEDAYILASHQDRIANTKKETEQQVLESIRRRNENQPLPANDNPGNAQFDPNNMSAKDIADISRRVQNGERITL